MSSQANVIAELIDRFSPNCIKMKDANKGFNTSLEDTSKKAQTYHKRIDDIISATAQLQQELAGAKKEMQAAQKEFNETGSQAANDKFQKATEQVNGYKLAIANAGKELRATQKNLDEMRSSESKLGNSGDIISQLGAAGATAMLGSVLSQAVGSYASSALGSAGGNYISSALSSAGMGASIGMTLSSVLGPIGPAIGAAIGSGIGLITAKMDEITDQDEAFKSTVQDTYNDLQNAMAASLQNGSSIAGSRQTTQMSFTTLLGSSTEAAELLNGIKDFSNSTPYLFDDLTTVARQLLAYGFDQSEIMQVLSDMGNASSALGAGSTGMSTIAEVLGRMNMGSIENEQLKRLIDLGINPYQMLADQSNKMAENGKSMISSGNYSADEIKEIQSMIDYVNIKGPYTADVIKQMVTDGLIPAKEAAQALSDAMGQKYAGSLEAQAQTFEGLTSTLQGLNDELDDAMGGGYNNERLKGMQEQVAYLNGEGGQQMQEAYEQIGEFQASLENKQEQLQRDAIQSVMNGVLSGDWSDEAQAHLTSLMADYDEAKLKNDGAEMGRVVSSAKSIAQAEYTKTDGYQQQVDANKALVSDIQEATANSYYTAGYELAQEQTKGYVAGMNAGKERMEDAAVQRANRAIKQDLENGIAEFQSGVPLGDPDVQFLPGKSHAYGLNRVPYDNYLARLHEGERVLTASQARQQDAAGGAPRISITGNSFTVREEADIDKIAGALYRKICEANLTYVGGS